MDIVDICNAQFNDPLEKDWRDSLPHYTFFELMEIFPSAIPAARRGIRARLKALKVNTALYSTFEEYVYEKIINKAHFSLQNALSAVMTDNMPKIYTDLDAEIARLNFHLKHLDAMENPEKAPVKKGGVDDVEIERARLVPMKALVKVTPMKKMICLWHNDRHPSAHVYPDHGYCFVCSKRFDTIDVARHINGLTFVEAVKWLNQI